MVRVAINGFGRIGRMVLRAGAADKRIEFVAVNDVTDAATLAHLLKYDSIHGRFSGTVKADGNALVINGRKVVVLSEKDPANLPWKKLNVDVAVESTGIFTKLDDIKKHLAAGAKKVLLSAPAKDPVDLTIVKGVNDSQYDKKKHSIVSNASCTTNCLAPMVKVLNDSFKVKRGFMNTVHAYTNDQKILDLPHRDLRRARAAALNIIPTTTGAAKTVAEVIPELKGKLDGLSMRVPVGCGSVVDFTCEVGREVTVEQVNDAFRKAANGRMKGVMEYSEEELVSSDIVHTPFSVIFDSKLTNVIDRNFVKVVGWYDNEWGYSCRMVDIIKMMA